MCIRDRIVGLPEETIDDVRQTMEEIKALRPDSVTVHSLAIKRAARLKDVYKRQGADDVFPGVSISG